MFLLIKRRTFCFATSVPVNIVCFFNKLSCSSQISSSLFKIHVEEVSEISFWMKIFRKYWKISSLESKQISLGGNFTTQPICYTRSWAWCWHVFRVTWNSVASCATSDFMQSFKKRAFHLFLVNRFIWSRFSMIFFSWTVIQCIICVACPNLSGHNIFFAKQWKFLELLLCKQRYYYSRYYYENKIIIEIKILYEWYMCWTFMHIINFNEYITLILLKWMVQT